MNTLFLKRSEIQELLGSIDFDKLAEELSVLKPKELVKRYGKIIGQGSSRQTYKYNDDYVIKRAKNEKGLNQNDKEYDISNMFQGEPVAQVVGASKDSKIIISQYAKPIGKFSKAIKKKIGIEEKELHDGQVREILHGLKWEFLGNWDWGNNFTMVYLKKGSIGFIGDFLRPSSWGKYKGKYVLIDYGY